MTHVRALIREQAVAELDAGIPEFLEVASTRLYAYREDMLPSLNVMAAEEEVEVLTMGSQMAGSMQKRTYRRALSLVTELYATAAAEAIDDELDRLAAEVEKVLEATLLNGLAADIALTTTSQEIDAAGEIPVGVLTLTWLVIYRTLEGDPEVSV